MSDFYKKTLRSLLDAVILEAIAEKPNHGYSLILYIKDKFKTLIGPSTLYPILNDLEKQGYIKSEWNFSNARPQKQYHITGKGLRALEQMRLDIELIIHTVQHERVGD